MDNEQAKFILRAYRPGGQDAQDPMFAEALEQARRDPELGRWFAQETALDAAIGERARAIRVPSDLKAAILAGHKIIQPVRWWQRRIHPAAAAATVLLTLGLIGFMALRTPREGAADFRRFTSDITDHLSKGYGLILNQSRVLNPGMSYFGSTNYRLPFRSASIEDVRGWLGENNGHGDFALPGGLKDSRNLGCSVLEWRGKRVTVVCFQTGPRLPRDKVHLVLIRSDDLPDPPAVGAPRFHERGEWSTAEWNDGTHTYVLMAPGDRMALAKNL